ncbi:MAG: UDP-4-amino-4,6-dideoxy-N-acetyl-beta-L-altrosamine transaminase [Parachlamydiaceae bacterium]|nr:UDP-4-amino-4,6-dideoxy-N-acetyl-beta-L-altrosamine transaminase [Parachlamydiaceae bacterium]
MNDDFLPYARQSINADDTAAVAAALNSEFITRGPLVEEFEMAFANYCDAKFAVAFSNASTALLACCQAAEVNQFDRLITTPNTFVSTAGAAIHCGATPVFVDIKRDTGNLNLEHLAYTLERPRSQGRSIIMPVHFSGIAVDMAKLDSLITEPDAVVIEDAAHAIGSHYSDGQKVGSCAWSQMTVFSFHPAKTMTTGEGGMVTTNDSELYHRLKLVRNNGIEREHRRLERDPMPWYYEVKFLSNNFNFTEFQAALGISQMNRLNEFIEKRRQLVKAYRQRLSGRQSIRLFTDEHDSVTGFHLFVVQIDFQACKTTREKVMLALRDKNIGSQVHYIPLYQHPYFEKTCGKISEFFPETEKYYSEALSLPLYYDLSIDQVDYIVRQLLKVLKLY